jgi:hypothetical protein
MTVSRRELLQAAGLLVASMPLSGCEKIVSLATEQMGENIPVHLKIPEKSSIDEHFHLLSRAAYGPWPGDLDYLQEVGKDAWLHEQLNYESSGPRYLLRVQTIRAGAGAGKLFHRASSLQ